MIAFISDSSATVIVFVAPVPLAVTASGSGAEKTITIADDSLINAIIFG